MPQDAPVRHVDDDSFFRCLMLSGAVLGLCDAVLGCLALSGAVQKCFELSGAV